MTSAPAHRWRRRLLAAGLGLVLLVVLAEAGLWVLYWVTKPPPRELTGALGEGSRTILCTGDSNTFGVHLEPEDSYPGQLQAFLDRAPGNPWRVVNVGWPGNNSAQVRRDLAEHLERYRPELVFCWVGTNNTWSNAAGQLWDTPDREAPESLVGRLLPNVRVLRLGRMLANRLAGDDGAGKVMTPERVRETLEIDFRRIHALCEQAGARLMMADYPIHIVSTERNVNAPLRAIAAAQETPLVRLHDEVLPVVYGAGYDRTMFTDYHANGWGNHEVARRMLRGAIAAGLLEPREEWLAVPPLDEVAPDWPIVVRSADAERAAVRLVGDPGAEFRIAIGRRYSRELDKTDSVSLGYKPATEWTPEERARRGFAGRLDVEGRAELELLLPPEPQHPKPEGGAPVTWLGWDLTPLFGDEELSEPRLKRTVLVLRDPAVVGPGAGD